MPVGEAFGVERVSIDGGLCQVANEHVFGESLGNRAESILEWGHCMNLEATGRVEIRSEVGTREAWVMNGESANRNNRFNRT